MSSSQILAEDSGLALHLHGERHAAAVRDCVAQVIHLRGGPWSPAGQTRRMAVGIGLLVLDGLLTRRVGVDGRFGAELLGEGDLLRPWQREDMDTTVPHTSAWLALRPCRMAVLDSDFAVRLGRYPEVTSALFARAVGRSRHLAVNMAIVHHPRVDVRLHMLFWALADRWGTVHRDGIHVPVSLTHAALAELVAARRPTVSKALGELSKRGVVRWTGEAWLLIGDPPVELHEVRSVSVLEQGSVRDR